MTAAGLMSPQQRDMYVHLFHGLKNVFPVSEPAAVIYLRTPPETCLARLQKRNRSEEVGVSLSYLQSIHGWHEKWLSSETQTRPVLVLDGERDYISDPLLRQQTMAQLQQFVKALAQD